MRIEPGIREVQWKTKDGTKSRFQVRIKRKEFEASKLFDTLKEARDFKHLTLSDDGRRAVTEFSKKEDAVKQWMTDYIKSPPLRNYIDKYRMSYLIRTGTPTKETTTKSYEARLRTIKETVIRVTERREGLRAILPSARGETLVKLGDMKLDDLNEQVATDYIRARLAKGFQKVTVKSEVAMMQAFFNKLRFIDLLAYQRLKGNPFELADKSLLKDSGKKRRRRISEEEEERLFAALGRCENPEMIAIVALALASGCRRGELLELTWDRIHPRTIEISDGKSGWREIPKSDLAEQVIATIARKDERLFHYTSDGFSSNWDRVKKWANITDLRMHDTRREFISRCVEKMQANALMLMEATSLSDPTYIQTEYIDPLSQAAAARVGINSEADLMRAVGHRDRRTTALYFTPKGIK